MTRYRRPKPVRRPSWYRGKSATWHRSRLFAESRAKGRCEARCAPDCEVRGSSAHHIVPRRPDGGSDDAANLLWLCWPCHRWIHDHETDAAQLGLIRRRRLHLHHREAAS